MEIRMEAGDNEFGRGNRSTILQAAVLPECHAEGQFREIDAVAPGKQIKVYSMPSKAAPQWHRGWGPPAVFYIDIRARTAWKSGGEIKLPPDRSAGRGRESERRGRIRGMIRGTLPREVTSGTGEATAGAAT
ncbi:hypothetical protein KM043_003793 [Ampulex compressa]|nr:hypothetical protein KM043_003793 [Ampulex compressa]